MIPIETFGKRGFLPDVSKIPINTVVSIDMREHRTSLMYGSLNAEFNEALLDRAAELEAELNVWADHTGSRSILIEFVKTEEAQISYHPHPSEELAAGMIDDKMKTTSKIREIRDTFGEHVCSTVGEQTRIRDKIFIIACRTTAISAALFVFWLFVRTDDDTLNILASIDLMVFAIAATLVFAMWEDCT